jgi:hypothetical protein
MRILTSFMGVGLIAMAVPVAAADVSVAFVLPERYTDAGYSHSFATERDRTEIQRGIEQHLQRLAERGLPASDTLKIEVLDIDLAGRFEPWRRLSSDVRIVSDISWPRIKLRYMLTRGDQLVAGAEEQIADLNYLVSLNRYPEGDRLRYEKAMLDDWFEKRIAKR